MGLCYKCAVPEKIHTHPMEGHQNFEFPRGREVLKFKVLEPKYEDKLEFPGGWGRGVQNKKTFHGGSMDIF